jgi:hypothetical protein
MSKKPKAEARARNPRMIELLGIRTVMYAYSQYLHKKDFSVKSVFKVYYLE